MFYRFIIIILILAFANDCKLFGQEKVKGGYRECTTYIYKYKNGELDSNSKQKEFFYKYDNHGNQIEMAKIKLDSSIVTYEIYNFDEKGNLISWRRFGEIDTSICEIHYDTKGNKVEELETSKLSPSKRNYKYDSVGKPIEIKIYELNNSIFCSNEIKYDEKGKLIEEWIDFPDNINSFRRRYKYDEGVLFEIIEYKLEGPIKSKTNFVYDKKGNVIESIFYLQLAHITKRNTYKYNDEGNKIEEIRYNNLTEPYKKIEYIYSK
jgi:hypothetical protein